MYNDGARREAWGGRGGGGADPVYLVPDGVPKLMIETYSGSVWIHYIRIRPGLPSPKYAPGCAHVNSGIPRNLAEPPTQKAPFASVCSYVPTYISSNNSPSPEVAIVHLHSTLSDLTRCAEVIEFCALNEKHNGTGESDEVCRYIGSMRFRVLRLPKLPSVA